ncbi:MAG: aldose epimerase family protein [Eubacteriales bacterium]|jgi:aldose 1-epimerase
MKCYEKTFGRKDTGEEVRLFHLENGKGMEVEIIELGAIIHRLVVPDRNGVSADVVMGQETLENYINNPSCSAAVVGRFANRISGAAFTLNGQKYLLDQNDGNNTLHSGVGNYSRRFFTGKLFEENDKVGVTLYYKDNGEGGFPGTMDVWVTYALDLEGTLEIQYKAVPDTDTIISLTNHAYFNLSGHMSGSVENHLLQINADFYLPNDPTALPTGEVLSVTGTDMDFNSLRPVGDGFRSTEKQLVQFGGYDHNYCLRGREYRKVAELRDPSSGRGMEVYTDLPGMQLYTSNAAWKNNTGKGGAIYQKHGALCLETQHFPNAINMSHFPSPIYRAGETFQSVTAFKFFSF